MGVVTVLGAIQWESYGFQTFFANRVGEIQKAGPLTDWWWIPGQYNVADLFTRGYSPEQLGEDSSWQTGSKFLTRSVKEYPIKSAPEVAYGATEVMSQLQRKAFSAITTRYQKRGQTTADNQDDFSAVVDNRRSPEHLPFNNEDASSVDDKEPSSITSNIRWIKRLWVSTLINQVDLSKLCGACRICP